MMKMRLHRSLADEEARADFAIATAGADEPDDLTFPPCQRSFVTVGAHSLRSSCLSYAGIGARSPHCRRPSVWPLATEWILTAASAALELVRMDHCAGERTALSI